MYRKFCIRKICLCLWFGFLVIISLWQSHRKLCMFLLKDLLFMVSRLGTAIVKPFYPRASGGRAGAWAGGRSGLETRPRVTPASLVVGFKTEPRFKRRGDMQIPSLFLFPLFRFVPALLLRFAIVRSTINPFFSFPSVRKIALDNPLSIIDILSENSFSFFSFLNDVFLLRYFCPSTLKMNDECEKY